tara:strand:- start:82 stop:261 length:180 start_codon:yes stop_codon:yes gene_type:complete
MKIITVNSVKYTSCEDTQNNALKADIDGVLMLVPIKVGNRHYDAILEWVAEGNTIEAAD